MVRRKLDENAKALIAFGMTMSGKAAKADEVAIALFLS
jgi:hypothetical protein